MREVGERSETDGSSPGNSTRIGFTGHQQDNDIGFTDMGGRVYDSLAGRFTTADPVMQAPFWSQGQNRYAYVFNDPINATDPSGFITTGTTGGDIATAGVFGVSGGAVAYGIATELGRAIGSINPAGSLGGSVGATGLGVLHSLSLTPGGPAPNTSYSVATPSAAPTSALTKANGFGDATTAALMPGPGVRRAFAQDAGGPESGASGTSNSGDSATGRDLGNLMEPVWDAMQTPDVFIFWRDGDPVFIEQLEAGIGGNVLKAGKRLGRLPRFLRNKLKRIFNAQAAGGNRGIPGVASIGQALELGKAFVGAGFRVANGGKALVSSNGLRQFRLPSVKSGINPQTGRAFSRTGIQVNFESREIAAGRWTSNVHLDVDL